MSYPASLDSFTTKTNKVDLVDAAHINAVQAGLVAIETELGTDPAGSVTDVKTRLYVGIDNDGAIRKGTSFPASPIEGQPFYRTDEDRFYIYDGTSWDAIASVSGIPTNMQVFEASGTWTRPAGVNTVWVKVIGAGGNGAGASSTYSGGGGGGGGYSEGLITVSGNVTVTIGATNSFAGAVTIQATSGSNGSAADGGAGGVGSNGTINLTGATGGGGGELGSGANSDLAGGMGGSSAMGGGGGGGKGEDAGTNRNGANGGQYGGGGGGGGQSNSGAGVGGTGNAGAVIVYWVQ